MSGRDLAHVAHEPVPGWPAPLIGTLAAVFDTLLPAGPALAARRAHLGAETLSQVADPGELRLLKLAIRSLDWPPALLATAGRWGRFTRLAAPQREAVLLAWSRHPLPRLRTAFQAMKRLGLFLAYADPGSDDAGNPTWPRIGYRPPEPVAAPEPSIAPIDLAATAGSGTVRLEADVVVVGSGAGGGVVAARMAAAGRSVVVVEAGPYLAEPGMPVREAAAMQRLYLDQGTTASSDLGVTVLAGHGLGGGTTVNWTTSIVPPDWVLHEWEDEHGIAGLAGAETAAILARLRDELDLQPPTIIPPKDRVILDGAAALGWEAAPTERNAGPCLDCGACGFGCRAGSKRSGLRLHLAAAASDGARFLVDAEVERVRMAGDRATGIAGTARTAAGPRPFEVHARQVVVAAGALRSPLLLHASGIAHPQLGRNLRLHPVVAVGARMAEPVEMWLGPMQAARSLQFWRPGAPDPEGVGPAHGGFVIESAPPHPGLLASAFPWDGAESSARRMDQARFEAPLLAIVRDRGSGHVHWSRHRRARIDYALAPADATTARRALVELARLARAAGALEVTAVMQPLTRWRAADGDRAFAGWTRRLARTSMAANRISLFSAHQMGTVRAGADSAAYPCDPWGRVRSGRDGRVVAGLFVADSSLFPSPSGVNPMVSVMLLADRVARAVGAE